MQIFIDLIMNLSLILVLDNRPYEFQNMSPILHHSSQHLNCLCLLNYTLCDDFYREGETDPSRNCRAATHLMTKMFKEASLSKTAANGCGRASGIDPTRFAFSRGRQSSPPSANGCLRG